MTGYSRRRFLQGSLGLAGLGLLTGCGLHLPSSQAPPGPPRIGVLIGSSAEAGAERAEALRDGLREHGYVEGQNIIVEWHFLGGRTEAAPDVARELVRLGVAAIVAGNPAAVEAAKQASGTVPIILAGVYPDPVGFGVAASLARPGGSVTGLSLAVPTLPGKRLQLLKETVPGTGRVGVLFDRNLGASIVGPASRRLEEAGRSLGMEVRVIVVEHVEELEPAFAALRSDGTPPIYVTEGPLTLTHAGRIAELALQHRLPVIYGQAEFARAGGLMAFGVDQTDLYRRTAAYVDKVLKGAGPAELPIEQPTKFDFVINLKAAEALGLTIPHSILQQATEIIQ